MRKLSIFLAVVLLTLLTGITVFAQETKAEAKTVVALGADLSAEQRAAVLSLFGLTEETLKDCRVITVTNAQEHQYLDDFLPSSVIGSKSLSSVMLVKGEAESGVSVTTRNINYCTTGMYRNALLTAGLKDTQVTVAAPAPLSGTAGLIGAVKAYEAMENITVSDTAISNAVSELLTTGELADSGIANEDVEQLIAFLKEKAAAGDLETEEDIRAAVKEGEERYKVTLSAEEVDKIVNLVGKLKTMGLDSNYLLGQAQKLYEKYGADIVNHADEAIKEAVGGAVTDAVGGFFKNMGDSVKSFFDNILK